MIVSCGHDERGKFKGGKAGDQTGTEYAVKNWYQHTPEHWGYVLRYPDQKVADKIAEVAIALAKGNRVGYDQNERTTLYKALKANGWRPEKVSLCEADCSASTAATIICVGYLLSIGQLKNVNPCDTTMSLRSDLKAHGFKELTESKYLNSDRYLKKGDIVLCEGHHVIINVTDGQNARKTVTTRNTVETSKEIKGDYTVTALMLNMRKAPGTDAKIVAVLKNSDTVHCDGKHSGAWYHVSKESHKGYCSSKYLKHI